MDPTRRPASARVWAGGRYLLLAAAMVLAAAGPAARAAKPAPAPQPQVVFDNIVGDSITSFGPSCCHVGNQVDLAGGARKVVALVWAVDSQHEPVVAEIETHIYANDGPDGRPGTLIWQSGRFIVDVAAADKVIEVPVPGVIVPDTITVTSRFLTSAPVALGRRSGGPPATGSLVASWIETSPGVWLQFFGPWGQAVSAIPAAAGGRMTGEATIGGTDISYRFAVHGEVGAGADALDLAWGPGNRFQLRTLTFAACVDTPGIAAGRNSGGFDTCVGEGAGDYNGVPGHRVRYLFTDAGEPGRQDFADITLFGPDGVVLLKAAGTLAQGNHQAHGR